jgi:hypothetical protein
VDEGQGIPKGSSNKAVRRTFSAIDLDSGIAYTEYRLQGGPFAYGLQLTVSGEDLHALAHRSVDRASQVEDAQTATVRTDTVGPTPTALSEVIVKGCSQAPSASPSLTARRHR